MVIEVQENGEIFLPEIFLTELGIEPGDIVHISEIGGEIFIKPLKLSEAPTQPTVFDPIASDGDVRESMCQYKD